jgi:hypothetical protein
VDFTAFFAKPDNSTAITHPGGAVFNILPYMSQDIQIIATKKLKLSQMDRYQSYQTARDKNPDTKMGEFFDTLDEVQSVMRNYLACHVTGWSNLTMNGEPLEFSYETTQGLIEASPPFAEWLLTEAQKLAEPVVAQEEVAEDIKKKSDDTSQS